MIGSKSNQQKIEFEMYFYLKPKQVELLIRLQTQRIRDSEFNSASGAIITNHSEESKNRTEALAA